MSFLTYSFFVSYSDKPLVWLHGFVKTPPFSQLARLEAGFLLRRLQIGERLGMSHSRPLPSIGRRCHELRINETEASWRIIYRIDKDAIIIIEVAKKKTAALPVLLIETCRNRLKDYDNA